MKCKNCEYEQEKDFKHCPECGLPVDDKQETPQDKRSKKAFEMLERIDQSISGEREERKKRREEHEKRREQRKKRTVTKGSRGNRFLDLF